MEYERRTARHRPFLSDYHRIIARQAVTDPLDIETGYFLFAQLASEHHDFLTMATLFLRLRSDELNLLELNRFRSGLPAGLPLGTRIAFKNGWFPGLRHSAGIITPPDASPYALAVCYTGPLANGRVDDDPAARLLARISAGIWRRRARMELRLLSSNSSPPISGGGRDGIPPPATALDRPVVMIANVLP